MSSLATTPLKVAKLLKLHLLLETADFERLFKELPSLAFYSTAKVVAREQGILSSDQFLMQYERALMPFKKGARSALLVDLFSFSMSATSTAVEYVYSSNEKVLYKAVEPLIQLSPTFIRYSEGEGSIRMGLYSAEAILFGVTMSYPQLLQEANGDIVPIDESPRFINTAHFHKIRRWLREHTIATPFVVAEKRINMPIRISRACLSWAANICGLKEQGISIHESS